MSQKKHPLKYFLSEISPYRPIKATCPSCKTETTYSSHIHLSTSEGSIHINYYQCQSCGKLETSDEKDTKGIRVALESKCECGGQFRRDKNIFCPVCQYRQSDENKSEKKLFATSKEIEKITQRHDSEEMKPPYKGDDIVKVEEDYDDESDMRKLIRALHDLTKDGRTFEFGFSTSGKGDHHIDSGLNSDMEDVINEWLIEELYDASNFHPTDYVVTSTDTGIKLDCTANWDSNDYDEDYHSYEDLIDKEIVSILLPNHAYESVNLKALPFSFEYSYENNNYQFVWYSNEDTEEYIDEASGNKIIIPMKDLKPKLEPLLHKKLYKLDAGDGVGETILKIVSIDYGRISVSETGNFQMHFDIDDY